MNPPLSAEVQVGAFAGALHPRCSGALPYKGNAPTAAPTSPGEVQPIRLILTLDQTAEVVRQAGGESHHGRVFVTLSPGSYPTAPGRLVLNLIECPSIASCRPEIRPGLIECPVIGPALI